MDLNYSPEDEAFRSEVRDWLEANVPPEVRDWAASRTTIPRKYRIPFYKALRAKGWMCPRWPKEYGGPGFSLARQVIMQEEMGRSGAPNMDLGVIMAAPMIMEFGTADQKARYLPRMLEAEELWCQGYSEPNAGSDLANLATTAVIDGDDFILNGQKVWTSNGHESEWMFLLVRTDAGRKKQDGISFLLMDMATPGITVRPIHQITDSSNFSEVFLHDVRVPRANLLGNLNEGWTIAKRLLTHERVGVYSGDLIRRWLVSLIDYARAEKDAAGRPLIEDPAIRRRAAALAMQIDAAGCLGYRNTTRMVRGEPPGPESSVVKVFSSETFQRVLDLGQELQGAKAQLWLDPNFPGYDYNRPKMGVYGLSFTISGGTSEIQRNVIAETVLGMPR